MHHGNRLGIMVAMQSTPENWRPRAQPADQGFRIYRPLAETSYAEIIRRFRDAAKPLTDAQLFMVNKPGLDFVDAPTVRALKAEIFRLCSVSEVIATLRTNDPASAGASETAVVNGLDRREIAGGAAISLVLAENEKLEAENQHYRRRLGKLANTGLADNQPLSLAVAAVKSSQAGDFIESLAGRLTSVEFNPVTSDPAVDVSGRLYRGGV